MWHLPRIASAPRAVASPSERCPLRVRAAAALLRLLIRLADR